MLGRVRHESLRRLDHSTEGSRVREEDRTRRTPHRGNANNTETGSYLRLIDLCITQLKAQGPSRTCNESKEQGDNPQASRASAITSLH